MESETGPAYFNPYRYLQPDYKNIFSNSLPLSAMPSAEKIIISSPLLSMRPLYSIEKIYFDSLIQYYDVYFWLGSDTFLMGADCILRNLDDFIIKRTQLVSAKKQDVLEGLGKKGLSVDNVIVLDHDAMLDTMNRLTGETDYAMAKIPAVLVGEKVKEANII